ncbi:MAG: glycosyltransferase family protein [Fibromonadaceae bacterium]|jgi:glycosyltransferase involved in cell wall biosynthesis|nr:glycosyltransferase family protein [Fibromonadaceae bacterium]
MISLITCSIKPDICKKMLISVSKTIGTEYETIVFDNREKKYGICKVYNEAAENANGDYLCFVHEDIEVQTGGWGKNLIEFASKTENCGIIGLAGGYYAPRNFVSWRVDKTSPMKVYDPAFSNNQELTYKYCNPSNEVFSRVVCIDGVFLFVKKKVWLENKFDEETFKNFHFYDADFSFAIAQKYHNHVYFGMDVYHFSAGNIEKIFCENMYLFQNKWKNRLPYCLPGYKISFRQELRAASSAFSLYRKNGFSRIESLKRIYRINGILFFIVFLVKKVKKIFCDKFLIRSKNEKNFI